MRAQFEFVSADFSPYPGEEQAINPNRYDRRLAEFLAQQLPTHSFPVQTIEVEDERVMVELENPDYPL